MEINDDIFIPVINKLIDEERMICPVCGGVVYIESICENCEWENSGEVNTDGGAMEMTLLEAIIAYREGKPLY